METRDLQTFLAVAETGSITKAAVLLERSQPSVTRTIQELEAKLGFSLLQRAGRRVMLSDEASPSKKKPAVS
ncbi:lysr family transcription regulator [Nitratireductor aquibiodomus RA22]|uniref:Lysr family transcription regulator n=1 Tax=Nitratireductor aquibiodomus RA22 TaxID=1189611 RepID=I5BRV4_9HYPH|nr:LysR family transcriptional regulator [Nitratireductor aquibiodomus]EIM72306.1 lysr family transcription regulator [Nitratireductor aquibiodomus RA22]